MKSILVIGQGIAGTLTALEAERMGIKVTLADKVSGLSASQVAAGIINPVTGRRLVKSWNFDLFYPVAKQCYQALEARYGIKIWHDSPILRLLMSPEESNDWSARSGSPEYTALLDIRDHAGNWQGIIPSGANIGVIHRAARVDLSTLLEANRQRWLQAGLFIEERFEENDFEDLLKQYDALVCCRGHADARNSFFPDLEWRLAKGEVLHLNIPELALGIFPEEMLKKGILLAPLSNGLVWAGSNYDWNFKDAQPTAEIRAFIEENIREMIRCPYDVVNHVAAIRPTVKERRPFVLQSPVHPRVFMLNGLGTKGTLLAPYFAQKLVQLIHNQ